MCTGPTIMPRPHPLFPPGLDPGKPTDKKAVPGDRFRFLADCDRDSQLILNLFVLLMSFFSCDWILLICASLSKILCAGRTFLSEV
jgi:hypothetical protein